MQIVCCFDIDNQQFQFFFELRANNLQNFAFKIVFYQQHLSAIYQKNSTTFYQNNQFMNSEFNQNYFSQNIYDCFLSNKCFYCYKNNHVFKRIMRDYMRICVYI